MQRAISIPVQLQYEEWAFQHGFESEVQVSLVADFLNGLYSSLKKVETTLARWSSDIHISKAVREAFYNAGQKLATLKTAVVEADIILALKDLFATFRASIMAALAEGSIMAGTGDCRNACRYNSGDSSNYANYGY